MTIANPAPDPRMVEILNYIIARRDEERSRAHSERIKRGIAEAKQRRWETV